MANAFRRDRLVIELYTWPITLTDKVGNVQQFNSAIIDSVKSLNCISAWLIKLIKHECPKLHSSQPSETLPQYTIFQEHTVAIHINIQHNMSLEYRMLKQIAIKSRVNQACIGLEKDQGKLFYHTAPLRKPHKGTKHDYLRDLNRTNRLEQM